MRAGSAGDLGLIESLPPPASWKFGGGKDVRPVKISREYSNVSTSDVRKGVHGAGADGGCNHDENATLANRTAMVAGTSQLPV